MQRLSIARSLRLALVGLTVALALVAALGIASLYNARQRYEDRLTSTVVAGHRGGQPGRRRRRRGGGAARRARAGRRGRPPPGGRRVRRRGDAPPRRSREATRRASGSCRRRSPPSARPAPLAARGSFSPPRSRGPTRPGPQPRRPAPDPPGQPARPRRERRPDPTPAARCCWSSSPACSRWAARSRWSRCWYGRCAVRSTTSCRPPAAWPRASSSSASSRPARASCRSWPERSTRWAEELATAQHRIEEERRRLAVTIESLGDALIVTEPGSTDDRHRQPARRRARARADGRRPVDGEDSPLPRVEAALAEETRDRAPTADRWP